MKNVLVLGSNGMAGHMISSYLENKYNVFCLSREHKQSKNLIFINEITPEKVINIVQTNKIDVLINCIGVLNENCDINFENCFFLNSQLPHLIAHGIFLKKINCKIIHLSTDCVFSGREGQYKEHHHKDGSSLYSISKSIGEINYGKNLTIRTSIIGPEIRENSIGLMDWFLTQQSKEIEGYKSVFWSGVTTLELAKAIHFIIENEIFGLIHLTNGKSISKFQLLGLINKVFLNNDKIIRENFVYQSDKTLVSSRDDFKYKVIDYDVMVSDLYQWMKVNSSIYTKYIL